MMMTPQEIFDKAYLGLKAQWKPSRSIDSDKCMYRGENGTCCGVGMLVPDAIAFAWDKRKVTGIQAILDAKAKGVEPWMTENDRLLECIQYAHDSTRGWDDPCYGFEANFARIAAQFKLTIPTVCK